MQNFIHDLYWPDDVFASHLEQRLKLMACDMIETSINQTMQAFQQWERKGNRWTTSTDYIIPTEMCTMINIVLESRNQSLKLCTFSGHDTVIFLFFFFSFFFMIDNSYVIHFLNIRTFTISFFFISIL